jgi:hypothetical protein
MLEDLDGNELCVIVKLISGENVMAVLQNEDEQYVELLHPMNIRTIPVNQNTETVVASPLCQFSDDETYLIDKKNVLFIKKLSNYLIPHYYNMLEKNGEPSLIREARERAEGKEEMEQLLNSMDIDKNSLH